jgi:AcrR family transcriptional regulator
MNARTVDWSVLRRPADGVPDGEGLRERKKRLMRQQLSDTATEMFVARGFDDVAVAEIAEACGVSEKTVFNYFPTKESLILDRWDATMERLRTVLADPGLSPVEATMRILSDELSALTSWIAAQDDPVQAGALILRFGALLRSTPSLRAHQHETTERLAAAAAEILARRTAIPPGDPEPQIAATALLGLWPIQSQSLRKHLDGALDPARLREAVTADVERAARLIDTGLSSFGRGS